METILIAGVLSLVAFHLGTLHGVRVGATSVFKALHRGGVTIEQMETALRAVIQEKK